MDTGWVIAIIVVAAIIIWYVSAKAKARRTKLLPELRVEMLNHPVIGRRVRAVEAVGKYDGSPESKRRAQREFDNRKNSVGCTSPMTSKIFWETLEQENLYIPLVASYAFSIGEYLSQPFFNPKGEYSQTAQDNVFAMEVLYPDYAAFVLRKHTQADARRIMILTSNAMESFFRGKGL